MGTPQTNESPSDFGATKRRIDDALEFLRGQLQELREQDVRLLRHLMQLHCGIHALSGRHGLIKRSYSSGYNLHSASDAGLLKATFLSQPRAPSVPGRHQSEPMQPPEDLESPDTDDDPLSWSFNSYGDLSSLQDRINDVSCPAFHKGRSLAAISEGLSEGSFGQTPDADAGRLMTTDSDGDSPPNDSCQWFLPEENGYPEEDGDRYSSNDSVFECSKFDIDDVDGLSFTQTPVYTTSLTCVPSRDIVVHSGQIIADYSDRDSVCSAASPSPEVHDNTHPLNGFRHSPDSRQNGYTSNHSSGHERHADSKGTQTSIDSLDDFPSPLEVCRKWNRRPSGLEQYEVPYADMLKRSSKLWREIKQEHDETGKVDSRKIIALKLFL